MCVAPLSYGIQLYSSTTSSLVAYSDADWAGCPTTRRSTSGYYVFLGNNLLSWSSKRQFTLSRSSAEAEYRVLPMRLLKLAVPSISLPNPFNINARSISDIDHYADIFTKGLPTSLFDEFRTSLSVRSPPAPTVGEC
ncbi:ribonuclease H-like domain-containing protein [Tanacetum coccineum]